MLLSSSGGMHIQFLHWRIMFGLVIGVDQQLYQTRVVPILILDAPKKCSLSNYSHGMSL